MPGCAAVGCSNSSKKGFIMKRFPKDPERRKEWAAKMLRDNWQPTDYSVLCEKHFEANMWEKVRVDGKKKLRFNAIPTLFAFKKPVKYRKSPAKRIAVSSALEKTQSPRICDTNLNSTNLNIKFIRQETQITDSSSNKMGPSVEDATRNNITSQELLNYYRTEVSKLYAKHRRCKNVLRNLERQVGILQNKIRKLDDQNKIDCRKCLTNIIFL